MITVLLVEDNPGDARLVVEELRDVPGHEFNVAHVSTLRAAGAWLDAATPDIVLLDMGLPDATGLDGLSTLRSRYPHTPVVVFTGMTDERSALDALQVGAQDYLVKGESDGPLMARSIRYAIERARAERAAQQEHDTQQRAETQMRFLAIVGHDLRGPLSFMELGLDALEGAVGILDEERHILTRIRHVTQRMTRMVRDMLDVSRLHASGRFELVHADHDVAALCRQAIEEQGTGTAMPLQLHAQAGSDFRLQCDADRLLQAISNLLSNASRHAAPGSAVIVALAADQSGLTILVHNEGTPIPPEHQPHLFDAFRRARSVRSSAQEGLGLGLFIVQKVVDAHGGTVRVASSDSAGTTFELWLPRSEVAVGPASSTGR